MSQTIWVFDPSSEICKSPSNSLTLDILRNTDAEPETVFQFSFLSFHTLICYSWRRLVSVRWILWIASHLTMCCNHANMMVLTVSFMGRQSQAPLQFRWLHVCLLWNSVQRFYTHEHTHTHFTEISGSMVTVSLSYMHGQDSRLWLCAYTTTFLCTDLKGRKSILNLHTLIPLS